MRSILVTGGAGFIGVNAAAHYVRRGFHVTVLDNLSRRGAELNLKWLQESYPVEFVRVDVRDQTGVDEAVKKAHPDVVLHLAAQVAVTTSVVDPRTDFEVNAMGAFNVLDAVRRLSPQAFFIFSSTNKVYGRMDDVGVEEVNGRYELRDLKSGVPESQPLDFHSPYGCSKGAADQYTLDFHKTYGLKTVTFRQSCIYGQRQFGVEDQGWVAWFLIASLLGKPLTIYGDGKQVRDLLHVDDLLALYDAAIASPDVCAGRSYNVGGGPANTLSLKELVAFVEKDLGRSLDCSRADWRTGDQPVFVADIRKAGRELGWAPRIGVGEGLYRLSNWVTSNRQQFQGLHEAVS